MSFRCINLSKIVQLKFMEKIDPQIS